MAPAKFGLFKARSRDYQEQPSTENLLHTSYSSEHVGTPQCPIPSTSKGITEERQLPELVFNTDSDDEGPSHVPTPVRRPSDSSIGDEGLVNYQVLKNQPSPDETSTSTLPEDYKQYKVELPEDYKQYKVELPKEIDDASTTYDANSILFDETSIAPSEMSVYCGTLKKKKTRSKEEKQLRDLDMWQASNVEVMQNLLSRSGTLDEQIKWEAIATARGLCTLTDSCTCRDCTGAKYLAGVADGDGGLGAAPLFNAISVGCQIQ